MILGVNAKSKRTKIASHTPHQVLLAFELVKLADKAMDVLTDGEPLRKGLNVAVGDVTGEAIASQFGYPHVPAGCVLFGAAVA